MNDRSPSKFRQCLSMLLLAASVACSGVASAQAPPAAAPIPNLSSGQKQLLRDYERFEKALFDIAEQARRKDPDRAELLYRARSQSQEEKILSEMEAISALLSPGDPSKGPAAPQYGSAADRQKELLSRLEGVLKLLQSLDERARIDEEIKRIQDLLKDANRLVAREKDVRADTRRGKPEDQLKNAQQKVLDETEKLAQKIDRQDEARRQEQQKNDSEKDERPSGKPSGDQQESKNSQDSENTGEGKSKEDTGSEQKPQNGQSPPSEQSPMPPGPQGEKPENQQPSPSPSPSGSQQEKQPPAAQQQTPGREQLEQARREMQKAIEELEQGNRDKAAEDQDQAVTRLEELKAELERILRQLREEEKETWLTLLEARLQGMLKRQQQINSDTVRLHAIPEGSRATQNYAAQTGSVRKEQSDNALEAEKTLKLLREEGSSVAFPEAMEQMHKNMLVVVGRLGSLDTGTTTQLLEKLIVETLEEMIAAFQKELEKQQEKKNESGRPQQGQPQDPSLVNQIAELKLIRSLQNQVNRLTRQIGTETNGRIPSDPDTLKLIEDLSARQQRIQDATYDLSIGRNR